ncbi:MAG: PilN domain-containing protein [Candidatus Nanopelagicales bacterium]|jgi:Tfp pilus assembly protein PilN|nr:PilN domain-containing protein [Candidatus Nanopelagicales bacterium]
MNESSGTPNPGAALAPDAGNAVEVTQAFVVPQVNLMPPRFAMAMKRRAARLTALACVIVAALVLVLGWLITNQQRSAAQEELAIASAEVAALHASAQQYADVPKVFADVADAQLQLRTAMGNEVRWSFFLNDLALTMPSGVSLDALEATSMLPGETPGAADGTDSGQIGALTVSAKALTFNHVANWIDSLAKLPTLADPEAVSLNAVDELGRTLVGFDSGALVTDAARSGRYTQEGGGTP